MSEKSSGRRGVGWGSVPLGKVTDAEAGRLAGTSATAARMARERRGIPRLPAGPEIDWDAQPLGEESDYQIAERLGVSAPAVYYARKVRGIESSRPQRPRCSPEEFSARLGTVKDREIAEEFGIAEGQVSRARRKLGIHSRRINWSAVPELGTAPDIVVARKYGVDNKVVAAARWARGVQKWQEERQCPCGENFTAFHGRQRYCSSTCQRYHWHLAHKKGIPADAADCGIAMRAYKATLAKKTKGVQDVDEFE